MMKYSPLQKARYEYAPKLPGMLRNGIAEIGVKEGQETQSVADQEKIKALFPNTYGKKEITFEKGQNTSEAKKQVVGVILSGGQAPGGHNVVCGLYDALKATNKDNVLYGFKNGPSGLIDDDFLRHSSFTRHRDDGRCVHQTHQPQHDYSYKEEPGVLDSGRRPDGRKHPRPSGRTRNGRPEPYARQIRPRRHSGGSSWCSAD